MGAKKRWLALFLACALVAACATESEKRAATTAWADCVKQAVARVDDGKTDPVSIAYGVEPQCASLYQQLTEMMVRENITDAGQANMRALMKDGELKQITAAVLAHRASRR